MKKTITTILTVGLAAATVFCSTPAFAQEVPEADDFEIEAGIVESENVDELEIEEVITESGNFESLNAAYYLYLYCDGSDEIAPGGNTSLHIDYSGYDPADFEWTIDGDHDEDTYLSVSDDNTSAILYVSENETNEEIVVYAYSTENPDYGNWFSVWVELEDPDEDDEDYSFKLYSECSDVDPGDEIELWIEYTKHDASTFGWEIVGDHDADTYLSVSDDNIFAILYVSEDETNSEILINAWCDDDEYDESARTIYVNDLEDPDDDDDVNGEITLFCDGSASTTRGGQVEFHIEYTGYEASEIYWDVYGSSTNDTHISVLEDGISAILYVSEDEVNSKLTVGVHGGKYYDDEVTCDISVLQGRILLMTERVMMFYPAHPGETITITATSEDVSVEDLAWSVTGNTSEDTHIETIDGSATARICIGKDETSWCVSVRATDTTTHISGDDAIYILEEGYTGIALGDMYFENGEFTRKSGLAKDVNGHAQYVLYGYGSINYSGYATFIGDEDGLKYYVSGDLAYDEAGNCIGCGMVDYSYTGFATSIGPSEHGSGEGPEIYFVNGVECRKTGLVQNADGEYVTIKDGVLSEDVTGLVQKLDGSDSTWYYVENGELSTAAGLAQKADGSTTTWLYVENGVYTKKTGLAKKLNSDDTNWYYIYKGNVRTASYYKNNGLSNTGLAQKADGSTKTWLYVENGVYTKSTGLAQKLNSDDTNWYYVYKGNVRTASYYEKNGLKADGLVCKIDTSSDTNCYYIQDGVYTKKTGLAQKVGQEDESWYYVYKGVFAKNTGIAKKINSDDSTWYYVKKGIVSSGKGITQKINSKDTKWYYVQDGIFTKATGVAQKADSSSSTLYYVSKGVYTKTTCIAQRADGSKKNNYYVKNGKVDTKYTGWGTVSV